MKFFVWIGWKANSLESWKVVAESMETRCCRVHGNFITFVGKLLPSPCWPKPLPSLHSILRSFIGLRVKLWHRNAHTSVPLPDSVGICRPYAVPLPDSIGIRHKCCFQNLYQICSILTQKNKTGSHRRTRHGGADLVETTHFAHLHTAYIWWRLGTWFYIWYHSMIWEWTVSQEVWCNIWYHNFSMISQKLCFALWFVAPTICQQVWLYYDRQIFYVSFELSDLIWSMVINCDFKYLVEWFQICLDVCKFPLFTVS